TNATAVAALCHHLGVDATIIQAGLNDFQPPAGRGAPLASTIGAWQVIDDCYNANPGSMRAALHNLAAKNAPGRKLALLGDMLELGETGPQLHAQLADDIINGGVDQLFTAGPLMANLHQAVLQRGSIPCHHQDDPAQWCGQLVHHLKEGDIILVKGSRGMRLERLVREIIGSS
ncbi:MAG: UDP-N-acetylmuramoylalanyl-D-glutamyl-2, 6-diaminopimelate--D-alanyl-D-alanine ligase, partial [Magnetococcales bacterium]|nr:UDP-N-acetylmuramoylalanyl-D-glutamyl-2, 6-diaminopimelate--D-alanyl-D-alanine ligase [Magnetococcales bacterium]